MRASLVHRFYLKFDDNKANLIKVGGYLIFNVFIQKDIF